MMEAKRSQIKKGAGSPRHKFFLPETLLCDISSELLQLPAPIFKLQIIASSTTCSLELRQMQQSMFLVF
jgi:hypothetical protein